ncbi:MAG: PfkB family carbohydrate kinase [Treponema sp.]
MTKVVTLGELMLRLTPKLPYKFLQASSFDAVFGGSEANVAVSLSLLGLSAYYVTKLPDNDIGDAAFNDLRKYGVKLDFVKRGGQRLGIYFIEAGSSMRPSKVIYDRSHSAIAEASIDDFDFVEIFKDATHFHFSGITPALSKNCYEITKEACRVAKNAGVTISVDLNYRKKLWSEEEARKKMLPLMPYVDICIGNEEDACKMLGFKAKGVSPEKGIISLEAYYDVFKTMREEFGFKYIATSLRESYSASENGWQGLLYNGKDFYSSKKYKITLVDRLGGGDAFSAGLIYSFLTKKPFQYAVEFATATSALKQTIVGDFNISSLEEIERLVEGDSSGRVLR